MGILRYGVNRTLEDAADALLRDSLKGVTKHSEKADILTPWKEVDRKRREVYPAAGVPDRAARSGMFHRAWNSRQPHLNSRDGLASFVGREGFSDADPSVVTPLGAGRGRTWERNYDADGGLADFVRNNSRCAFDSPADHE